MVNEDQFFEVLKKSLIDGEARYYRNLVYIEKSNYFDLVKKIIELFLSFKKDPSVAYGFVPWAEGSKDRMKEIK
ncbi:hypothetical protein DJ528_11530, partial [Sulfolobus sp. B5]